MKIISKFKDYYDYLTGVYGVDPTVIYNRRPQRYNIHSKVAEDCPVIKFNTIQSTISEPDSHLPFIRALRVHACNKLYAILLVGMEIYFNPDDLMQIYSWKRVRENHYIEYDIRTLLSDVYGIDKGYGWRTKKWRAPDVTRIKQGLNMEIGCPLILQCFDDFYLNPKLDEFGFPAQLSAHDIFIQLTAFLSKQDIEMPSDPKDHFRYEAKGFDNKTSFRPKMKTR